MPILRQLDRARPLSAPVQGSAHPSADGSAQQVGTFAGSCSCGHSATWHARYEACQAEGCTCWKFQKRNAPALRQQPGA